MSKAIDLPKAVPEYLAAVLPLSKDKLSAAATSVCIELAKAATEPTIKGMFRHAMAGVSVSNTHFCIQKLFGNSLLFGAEIPCDSLWKLRILALASKFSTRISVRAGVTYEWEKHKIATAEAEDVANILTALTGKFSH